MEGAEYSGKTRFGADRSLRQESKSSRLRTLDSSQLPSGASTRGGDGRRDADLKGDAPADGAVAVALADRGFPGRSGPEAVQLGARVRLHDARKQFHDDVHPFVADRVDPSPERTSISFWDAMTVRSAVKIGCTVIYSEDLNHGQLYGGARIENPFINAQSAWADETESAQESSEDA